jgi:hypothetical protein
MGGRKGRKESRRPNRLIVARPHSSPLSRTHFGYRNVYCGDVQVGAIVRRLLVTAIIGGLGQSGPVWKEPGGRTGASASSTAALSRETEPPVPGDPNALKPATRQVGLSEQPA